MRTTLSLAIIAALAAAFTGLASAADAPLKAGDAAPDFSLEGTDGKTHKLADLKGKTVVVAWFPRADTPGCTIECKSFKEDGGLLRKFDVVYFTASNDPVAANKKFAEKLGLDYPILSDPSNETLKAYGVFNGKSANRVTFIIGPDGKILETIGKVDPRKPGGHAAEVSEKLKAHKTPEKK